MIFFTTDEKLIDAAIQSLREGTELSIGGSDSRFRGRVIRIRRILIGRF